MKNTPTKYDMLGLLGYLIVTIIIFINGSAITWSMYLIKLYLTFQMWIPYYFLFKNRPLIVDAMVLELIGTVWLVL